MSRLKGHRLARGWRATTPTGWRGRGWVRRGYCREQEMAKHTRRMCRRRIPI